MKTLGIFLILFSNYCFSNVLEVDAVIESSAKHYPTILEAIEKVESQKRVNQAARGAFDLTLEGKGDFREQGYYDGNSSDFMLKKDLTTMNGSIYTGYKISDGEFPSYEEKRSTLSRGEARAGISFSLLKNREIDKRRLKILNSSLKLTQEELSLEEKKIKIENTSYKLYYYWVTSGLVMRTYEDLLKISINRQTAMEKRFKKGDISKAYLIENEQYIQKRKRDLLEAENSFNDASLNLSLFLRDKKGKTIVPTKDRLPSSFEMGNNISANEYSKDLGRLNEVNPVLLSNKIELDKLDNKIKNEKNKLMPKLDLRLETSKDYGQGSDTLRPSENRAFLSFSIPIERNLGNGAIQAAKAKKRSINYKQNLVSDQIKMEVTKLFQSLNYIEKIIDAARKEMRFAKKLEDLERVSFKEGQSDFFVVNMREINSANAKIKYYQSKLKYKVQLANYRTLTFKKVPRDK